MDRHSMSQRAVKREKEIEQLTKERDYARKMAIEKGMMIVELQEHIKKLGAIAEAARAVVSSWEMYGNPTMQELGKLAARLKEAEERS